MFQRADGLSAIYDVFGPGASMGLPEAAFDMFLSSFSAAPLLGPTGPLQAFPGFRPTTSTPLAAVSGLLGYTPTPDFAPATDPNGGTRVSTGIEDFTVDLLRAQATSDAAVSTAEGLLAAEFSGVNLDASNQSDYRGLTHVGIPWSGTYSDGNAVSGGIDVYWDPNTTNAIAISRDWYIQPDGNEPSRPTDLVHERIDRERHRVRHPQRVTPRSRTHGRRKPASVGRLVSVPAMCGSGRG